MRIKWKPVLVKCYFLNYFLNYLSFICKFYFWVHSLPIYLFFPLEFGVIVPQGPYLDMIFMKS